MKSTDFLWKTVLFLAAFLLTVADFQAYATPIACAAEDSVYAAKKKKRTTKRKVDIKELVETINRLSAEEGELYLQQDSTATYHNATVAKELKKLKSGYSADALSAEYENRMVALSESEDTDSLLSTCLGALSTGLADILPMACEGIVYVMANRGDSALLEAAIRRFEIATTKEEADEMRSLYNDILNPLSFQELVKGTWISPTLLTAKTGCNGFPYYMLRINSLDKDNGIDLLNIPGETTYLENKDIGTLRRSQAIGGTYGHIQAAFSSEYLDIGNSSFAKAGFESTRDFRAKSRATISSTKASFGDKMSATIATELTAGLLDGLFSSTAQSYKHIAALNIDMTMESPVVMNVNTEYYNYTVNTSTMYYTPTPKKNNNFMMVKWEPEDGVYFVDSDNKVFSVTPLNSLELSEYNSIMEQYSYKNPKYLVPTIASITGGLTMMIGGIMIACDCNVKDKYGNQVYDSDGSKKLNKKRLSGGIVLAACGEIISITVPLVIYNNRTSKRAEAFTKLNKRQADKLSNKGKMSINPDINPIQGTVGMRTTITF